MAQGQGPIPIYQMMGNCVLPAPMPPPLISILFPNKFGQNPQTTPKALKQTAEFQGLGPLRATSGSEEGRGPSGCVSQSASCRPGRLVECAWGPGLQQEGARLEATLTFLTFPQKPPWLQTTLEALTAFPGPSLCLFMEGAAGVMAEARACLGILT